jgi:hypothetical protein
MVGGVRTSAQPGCSMAYRRDRARRLVSASTIRSRPSAPRWCLPNLAVHLTP